jgi:hypothetical protein
MRLTHFINEYKEEVIDDLEYDEIAKMLNYECSKYLKETKGKWFYRNVTDSNLLYNGIGYRKIRKDRNPLGTNKMAFDWFNKWLEKHGHVRRDRSVSLTSDSNHRLMTVKGRMACFIQGNYNYTWAATKDINLTDKRTGWYDYIIEDMAYLDKGIGKFYGIPSVRAKWMKKVKTENITDIDEIENRIMKESYDFFKKKFPKYFFTNKGITKAWNNQAEIWFEAKGFYFVHYEDDLYEYLKLNL